MRLHRPTSVLSKDLLDIRWTSDDINGDNPKTPMDLHEDLETAAAPQMANGPPGGILHNGAHGYVSHAQDRKSGRMWLISASIEYWLRISEQAQCYDRELMVVASPIP